MCRRVQAAYGGSHVPDGVGPLKYMAPESLQPPHAFSYKSDAFSFGVLMWETFAEAKPFGAMPAVAAAAHVLEGGRLDGAGVVPPAYHALMADCFQEDPTKRPTMQSIVMSLLETAAAA
ncbi:Aste57867_6980 [Aphanomyces stellatus]|nr:hypothetical protein As57867_006957 [Aphanomyces stellatus]VFT83932.1 Aste57867_6980 [Aphanomyces stellatus]